ncbi:serine/threonine-protein phosphatase 7-like isoform X2 [Corylus avellana]|uniref:serine/threonine-protein phosphatase 7-like isoform X2 n=1 Tax=Corylus avellana TaxID=13451 RepID=UPI00286BA00F|nr:serine/threonine-protein phosphatase 7-like isoform X2 [Corylus avellana]
MDREERIKNACKKIVECINAMSFVNLDDQRVHSLVMMREIARGVVENRDRKVTKSDVTRALHSSIEKMASACRDIVYKLSKMSYKGLDDERIQSLLRVKEIACKHAKVASVGSDLLIRESLVGEETLTSNNIDALVGGAEIMMIEGSLEVEAEVQNEDGHNAVQKRPVTRAKRACDKGVQDREAQRKILEDEPVEVEAQLGNEDDQNQEQEALSQPPLPQALIWPADDRVTLQWIQDVTSTIKQFSDNHTPSEFHSIMPIAVANKLIDSASSILSKEPNCVEIDCHGEDSRVVVVGDIHGQFHDLLYVLENAGFPSENQFYVFNGNYVDKGAWGLEVFLLLLAWKAFMPHRVYLLRGNHESKECTLTYGFEKEVKTKFGDQGEYVYNKCLECFKVLPLASIIAGSVYTTHGGLFRSIRIASSRRSRRKRIRRLELGSLNELSEVKRSLIDGPYEGLNILLADVLWSDPSLRQGLSKNKARGRGLWWGPDCTEAFLKMSKLKLIIRSHEGPDVRAGQHHLGDMLSGYCMDHDGESGKLYTLFSAPDYPQFGRKLYTNEGAYAVLKSPNFESPSFHSFKAVERPKADPFFTVDDEDKKASSNHEDEIASEDVDDEIDLGEQDLTSMQAQTSTAAISSSQKSSPVGMTSEVDFEALGISNPPSWTVLLPDDVDGTKLVQVPQAPEVEGLPLPPNLEEPHKSAYEYFFKLIAGLKHMLQTRETETKVQKRRRHG